MHLLPQTTVLLELLHNVIHVCAGGTQVHTLHTRWCLLYKFGTRFYQPRESRTPYSHIPVSPTTLLERLYNFFSFFFSTLLLHSYGSHIYYMMGFGSPLFVPGVHNHIGGFGRKLDPTSRFRLQTVKYLMTGIIVLLSK